MNFLKISSLIIGAGSVIGGTGAGIYYVTNRKNNEEEIHKKNNDQKNAKIQFFGKLVFAKKTATDNNGDYEIKFLTDQEYIIKVNSFNSNKGENEKYEDINKVIEISFHLNTSEATKKLNDILGNPLTLEGIKTKILDKESEIKELFDNDIYTKLKTKFNDSVN